jgi:hypothetical protein
MRRVPERAAGRRGDERLRTKAVVSDWVEGLNLRPRGNRLPLADPVELASGADCIPSGITALAGLCRRRLGR